MATLLLLGSKPEPVLPPRNSWQALACANASGRSARNLDLPNPDFTVISAIVTSRKKPANDLAVANLTGLRTGDLYFLPRPTAGGACATNPRALPPPAGGGPTPAQGARHGSTGEGACATAIHRGGRLCHSAPQAGAPVRQ